MTTIVSGFHPAGWDDYAERCLATFPVYWPADVELVSYAERPVELAGWEIRDVFACDGLAVFFGRSSEVPEYCGRAPSEKWKDKERARGYSYRFDAVKFCRQLFIPEHAAGRLPDGEVLAWFDADVLTDRSVPQGFIEGMLADDDLIYLGRGDKYSEIGFWAVRLGGATREFLRRLAETYRSGEVFGLREWHSAWVFDHVRKNAAGLRARSIAAPGSRGHVWFASPLGEYTDHLKGDRKRLGRSPERPQRRK